MITRRGVMLGQQQERDTGFDQPEPRHEHRFPCHDGIDCHDIDVYWSPRHGIHREPFSHIVASDAIFLPTTIGHAK